MGVYLSQPNTKKESSDYESGWLKCGVSTMQGWRMGQEDAHNCILDFDKGASFFAVYDGHGGHEVAEYTAKYLPDFIKKLESYSKKDFEQALIDAFILFDATLTQENVVAELKAIASSKNETTDHGKEDEESENVQELCEEARMPLKELIARYACGTKAPGLRRIAGEASSSSSPASPYLKAKPSASGEPGSSKEGSSSSLNGLPEVNGETENNEGGGAASSKSDDNIGDGAASSVINGEHSKSKESKGEGSSEADKSENDDAKASPAKEVQTSKDDGSPDDYERQMKSAIRYAKKKATVTMLAQLFEDGSDSDSDNDESFQANSSLAEGDDEEDDEEAEAEDVEEAAEEEEDDEEEEDSEDEDDMPEMKDEETVGNDSGCTAVAALLIGQKLFVANAGDSRAVICTSNGTAVDLSIDHKPDDAAELARITAAGGRVTPDGRVNGGLNLSRAIGDHFYKKCEGKDAREQMITALPDIKTWTVNPKEDEFLVLACDGIWNSLSSQEVVDFVRPLLKAGDKISSICEELFDRCLASDTLGDGTGCDNMTCIIVKFDKDLGDSLCPDPAKRSASPLPDSESNKRTKVDESSVSA